MKSLAQSPAILTVHLTSPGHYILRVAGTDHRSLVVGVSKLLEDATSLVVVTPTDTKVFSVDGDGDETSIDPEKEAAIASEEERALPGEEGVGETKVNTVIRRKKNPAPTAGHDEQCGRCRGEGKIQVLLDGGSPAETSCPICKGSGIMRRYGARR